MNDITKNLMCIKMMSGVEIWVEKDKAQKLINLLGTTQTKFVEIENEMINSANVEGVFTPLTMADYTHRKNGEWKCEKGKWHEKFKKCECVPTNEKGEIFVKGRGWMKQAIN